eukprot:GHRR01018934.1.p1 GENE.GHRR01018934.1~~GHRR01018934.1.p1  ORF type:complete len:111 (-),score=15.43 GHRR01018934.1:1170-1502(-)
MGALLFKTGRWIACCSVDQLLTNSTRGQPSILMQSSAINWWHCCVRSHKLLAPTCKLMHFHASVWLTNVMTFHNPHPIAALPGSHVRQSQSFHPTFGLVHAMEVLMLHQL